MKKLWNFLKAFVCGLFSLVAGLAFFLGLYFGLEKLWDYAIYRFGDFGIGFMTCVTAVAVLCMLIWLVCSFYKEFSKPKKDVFDIEQKRTLSSISKTEEYEED
jgi:uncharacterized membrane protein